MSTDEMRCKYCNGIIDDALCYKCGNFNNEVKQSVNIPYEKEIYANNKYTQPIRISKELKVHTVEKFNIESLIDAKQSNYSSDEPPSLIVAIIEQEKKKHLDELSSIYTKLLNAVGKHNNTDGLITEVIMTIRELERIINSYI